VAGRYRALLIGNSTYPADEHNLQTLKGPVKDIAALNRALIDPGAGLFADIDVTLLPEATSARAIRALGRFFGTADRDDVLLVYFSGHGKLDQSGRLHLCMQDTESTDLLSTAVSSARIKEFADASHARNVVIVLDCCYAGAFRGGDLGDAVAGPGRYVLTSCRGTQLANDATVENGTSFFTQHLVDGLVDAAADQDGDGYVTFSDLYAYVDRRLRGAGKQIPQRRVDGDGDVRLAKRPQPVPAQTTATTPLAGQTAAAIPPGQPERPPAGGAPPGRVGHGAASTASAGAGDGAAGTAPAAGGPRPGGARRKFLFAGTAAAVAVAGGAIAVLTLLPGGSGGNPGSGGSPGTTGTITATAPWRLKVIDEIRGNDNGCSITLTDADGTQLVQETLFGDSVFNIYQSGSFNWRVNHSECTVVQLTGMEKVKLPQTFDQSGATDTPAFAPPGPVTVHVLNFYGDSYCQFILYDAADGRVLDDTKVTPENDTLTFSAAAGRTVYLRFWNCTVEVSPGR
jgi:Caspase domain